MCYYAYHFIDAIKPQQTYSVPYLRHLHSPSVCTSKCACSGKLKACLTTFWHLWLAYLIFLSYCIPSHKIWDRWRVFCDTRATLPDPTVVIVKIGFLSHFLNYSLPFQLCRDFLAWSLLWITCCPCSAKTPVAVCNNED